MFSARMVLSFIFKYLDVFARTVMSYCLEYLQTSGFFFLISASSHVDKCTVGFKVVSFPARSVSIHDPADAQGHAHFGSRPALYA